MPSKRIGVGLAHRRQGARGFNPIAAGVTAWYTADPQWTFTDDAETANCVVTDPVRNWKDRSGNARPSWKQATLANRPVLVATGAAYGVQFDRGTSSIMSATGMTGLLTAGTIGILLRIENVATENMTYLSTGDGTDAYQRYNNSATYDAVMRAARVEGVTPMPSTGLHTQIYRSSGAGWSRAQDGVTVLTAAAGFGISDVWRLGGWAAGARYMTGPVFEVQIYPTVFDDDAVEALHDHLMRLA